MSKILLTITGPSGSGKTSVLDLLKDKYGVPRLITCTTRTPRENEVADVDYHFVSREDFEKERIIAPVDFGGNSYGIRVSDIYSQLSKNDVLAVIVEPKGAIELKALFLDADVYNLYIDIDPKAALVHMAHRDGWGAAKKRQKADFAGGLYHERGYELASLYDCVLKNDKRGGVGTLSKDIMNFLESAKWQSKGKENSKEAAK